MDIQKVDSFIMANKQYFHDKHIGIIREMLLAADDSKWSMIQAIQFKDPTTALIILLFAGTFGIDRFFIGNMGLGVIKLITCGGLIIGTFIDWFLIMGATRNANMLKLRSYCNLFC